MLSIIEAPERLPRLEEPLSWLPLDVGAKTVVEIVMIGDFWYGDNEAIINPKTIARFITWSTSPNLLFGKISTGYAGSKSQRRNLRLSSREYGLRNLKLWRAIQRRIWAGLKRRHSERSEGLQES